MSKIRVIGGFCKNGHLLDEENADVNKHGYVVCRQCRKDYSKANWAKHKEDPVFHEKMDRARREWMDNHPNYRQRHWLNRVYGMSLETYNDMLASQNNQCQICGNELVKPRVDHDHKCCPDQYKTCGKCIRGIICDGCNLMLGKMKDSEEILAKAIEYLRSYRESRESEK